MPRKKLSAVSVLFTIEVMAILNFPASLLPAYSQSASAVSENKDINSLYKDGEKLLLDNNYAAAADIFAQISHLSKIQKRSLSPLFECNYGIALLRQGKDNEATAHFQLATQSPSATGLAWINLANAYLEQGQLDKAQEALKQARLQNTNKEQDLLLNTLMQLIKEESTDFQNDVNKSDYFAQTTKNTYTRWNKSPVAIYLEPSKNSPFFNANFVLQAKQAFIDWNEASGNLIKIKFVDDPSSADIYLRWTTDKKDLQNSAEGGCTRYIMAPQGLVKSKISILIHDQADLRNIKLPANIIIGYIYHEVGHSLGLVDHSPNHDDVMYFYSHQVDKPIKLSERDKNTIHKLYSEPFKIDPRAKLNSDGIDQAQSGNFKQAIAKFEEALTLKTLPELTAKIVANLIRAHYCLALQLLKEHNYGQAEIHLDKLLQIAKDYNAPDFQQLLQTNETLLQSVGLSGKANLLRKKYGSAK